MTQRDMAGYLDIDRTTLYNWRKKKPNLYKTVMMGLMVDEIIDETEKNLEKLKELRKSFSLNKK